MPQGAKHANVTARLKRIEGQVRGIQRMVAERRYCIDILQQITAVRRALDSVALRMLRTHVDHCVANAIREGDGSAKISELMDTVHKFVK